MCYRFVRIFSCGISKQQRLVYCHDAPTNGGEPEDELSVIAKGPLAEFCFWEAKAKKEVSLKHRKIIKRYD